MQCQRAATTLKQQHTWFPVVLRGGERPITVQNLLDHCWTNVFVAS